VVPPVWIFAPTAANYLTLFASADFQRYLMNTLIVASVTSLLATTFGFLSAYSFTRFRYRGSTFLPLFYLVIRMVPRISLVVAVVRHRLVPRAAQHQDCADLVVHDVRATIRIWMMIGFLKELPIDLEEAAAVDGANRWQILSRS